MINELTWNLRYTVCIRNFDMTIYVETRILHYRGKINLRALMENMLCSV